MYFFKKSILFNVKIKIYINRARQKKDRNFLVSIEFYLFRFSFSKLYLINQKMRIDRRRENEININRID